MAGQANILADFGNSAGTTSTLGATLDLNGPTRIDTTPVLLSRVDDRIINLKRDALDFGSGTDLR
jgi:hypothetical protein